MATCTPWMSSGRNATGRLTCRCTLIGVLTDRYLGQARPLAEARLLFEIGTGGSAIRDLRGRLGLDSGYLSRLLRSLPARAGSGPAAGCCASWKLRPPAGSCA
jgi:hypothetical protein